MSPSASVVSLPVPATGLVTGVFSKAGADIPAPLIVGIPALAGLAAYVLERVRGNRRRLAAPARAPA